MSDKTSVHWWKMGVEDFSVKSLEELKEIRHAMNIESVPSDHPVSIVCSYLVRLTDILLERIDAIEVKDE